MICCPGPGLRCELVELVKYGDRKEEVLGVEFKDPWVNWGRGVRGVRRVVAVAYFDFRQ